MDVLTQKRSRTRTIGEAENENSQIVLVVVVLVLDLWFEACTERRPSTREGKPKGFRISGMTTQTVTKSLLTRGTFRALIPILLLLWLVVLIVSLQPSFLYVHTRLV